MKLLLIDGNSIMNRAFYGIRPLTTSTGINTNAIYGFLNIINKHMCEEMPCKICVAFDLKAPTYRHKLYEGYKAGRKAMPNELAEQFPIIKNVLDALDITHIECPGYEADDIIGILSKQCSDAFNECIIITGDRDSFQLINKYTSVKLATTKTGKSEDIIYNVNTIYDKYQLTPDQLIDLKALMGDQSDNIPGISGIGEKTALNLLHKFNNLDNIFNNTDKLTGSIKQKIESGKESAYLSKKLGTIIRCGEIQINFNDIQKPEPDISACKKIFSDLEMPSMLSKLCILKIEEEIVKKPISNVQTTVSDNLPTDKIIYTLLIDNFLYTENNGEILKTYLSPSVICDLGTKSIITHDAKPLIKILLSNNIKPDIQFDTMLAAYILDPSKNSYNLSSLGEKIKTDSYENNSDYVLILKKIHDIQLNELKNNNQMFLYQNIELPLCTVLADMENTGVTIDKNFLINFGEELASQIDIISKKIYTQSDEEFNINSPKQLGYILFDKLNFKPIKKTKSGYSTNNEVLEKLLKNTNEEIIKNIIDYRKYTKLKSTYVDGLIDKIDCNNKIHSSFTQTVTQTGRISSVEPNLQNIPIRTEIGSQLRKAFIASEGCVLIDADYSQIELRVLADFSHDINMTEAFINDKDIHSITASQVFGLPQEMITSEWRRRAKAVNFGIVYGIGEYSLSQDIGVSVKEAKNYIANYLNTYYGVKQYMSNVIETARKTGYVETKFGRRRYVSDINSTNHQIRAFTERVCMNTPIQGTAADIIKLAMVKVYKKLLESKTNAKLILQIHDELIIEVPKEKAEIASSILKEEMQNATNLSVPLTVDVCIGKNWYEAKE